jgi:hypothetical protein
MQSRPVMWDWCPEKKCINSSCVVAHIYDDNDNLDPQKEYEVNDNAPLNEREIFCPHKKEEEYFFDVPLVPDLLTLCLDFIIKKGYAANIENFDALPESLCAKLFSCIAMMYTVCPIKIVLMSCRKTYLKPICILQTGSSILDKNLWFMSTLTTLLGQWTSLLLFLEQTRTLL